MNATQTTTRKPASRKPRSPRPKAPRSLRYYPGSPALLELHVPGCNPDPRAEQVQHYLLLEIPADWGRAFEVRKSVAAGLEPDPTVYHVHADEQLGTSCDCQGFLRWSHCKHQEAIDALLAAGRL
jgi:hypothetical protein